ncbi:MAG: metal ABC transporter substrate-binding protein [Planctomycetota bacterium]
MKIFNLILSVIIIFSAAELHASQSSRKILCTTFPIYQITRNVVKGRKGVSVSLMLPSQLGCPHDYALTPQDMQKLAKSDILIINGLGLEEFLGSPVKKANPIIRIIDSSAGIENLLEYSDNEKKHVHCHSCEHSGEKHEPHTKANPHLFASPEIQALLCSSIADQLGKIDPEGLEVYGKNASKYIAAMKKLSDEMTTLTKKLKNRHIVQPHGTFDYLARELGLEIVATLQPHGQEPSATELMTIVRKIKKKKAGAIFTEPQYPQKTAKTLSRETGIPAAVLDPGATGPDNAPLDYFEIVMRKNIKVIKSTLGAK